jgi:ABC-2 type transport system permease protein
MTEPTDLTPTRLIGLVAQREIVTRIRTRTFLISSAVLLVAVVAFPVIVSLTSGGSSTKTIGIAPSAAALAPTVTAAGDAVGQPLRVVTISDPAQGQQEVRDGTISAFITGASGQTVAVQVKRDIDANVRAAVALAARQTAIDDAIKQLGGDPARVAAAASDVHVTVTALTPPKHYQNDRLALGVVIGVLVYVSLLSYGQIVAQSVVEEKTSRVVELLLATLRPWQLMAGKVLGVGALGLTQTIGLAVIGGGVALGLNVLTIPLGTAAGVLALGVIWFLVGFFMFALMFAAIGALVSRQEEVGSATSPLMLLIIVPYILGVSILPGNPASPLIEVLSMIPLCAPLLMPMRIAIGAVPAWQVVVSFGLTVGFLVGLVWLAGRMYGNAVLNTGARVPLRAALRSSRTA